MRTITPSILLFIGISIFPLHSSAQENWWQVIRLSGDTLSDCRLDSLPEIILYITCNGTSISISLDSIAELRRFKETSFLKGAGNGFLVGGTIGALVGAASYQKTTTPYSIDFGPGMAALGGGLLGGAGGFIIGGIMSSSSNHYETYTIWNVKTLRMKRRIILQAF